MNRRTRKIPTIKTFAQQYPITKGPWWVKEGACGAMLGVMSHTGVVCMLGRTESINPGNAQAIIAVPNMVSALKIVEKALKQRGITRESVAATHAPDVTTTSVALMFAPGELSQIFDALALQRGEIDNVPPDEQEGDRG